MIRCASGKLLLHRKEINKLIGKTQLKGLTLVPLRIYFSKRGHAKVEVALARGRSSMIVESPSKRVRRGVRSNGRSSEINHSRYESGEEMCSPILAGVTQTSLFRPSSVRVPQLDCPLRSTCLCAALSYSVVSLSRFLTCRG